MNRFINLPGLRNPALILFLFTSFIILSPHSAVAIAQQVSDTLTTAPSPISAGDSLKKSSDMRMDELKAMLERETGEPVIEGTKWQREKNSKVAMLCALAVPGLGQIYNEKPFKAALAAGFEIFYVSRILHYYRLEKREEVLRDRYPRYLSTGGEDPVTYQNPKWTFHDLWAEEHRQDQIDYIWWSAGCMLVIVLDAYIDAHLHDMNFKIEGSPLEDAVGLSVVVDF